ncbi:MULTISPECIES: hypothetical protein [Streptomyces]|uniref:hypothetical protein n=1 Tax=Streptomyces TaxID=1883 RepID=UPI00163D07F6|nr:MULTISPECIES: hypothetical protein [Streptomyces]MBC2873641.1 hypothetical protein [Streptomyces sp. TYQ1024]UBI37926.1 hypothetical protein K7I03_16575 [Streptomyces mobaraensis]UKW30512.1 hypothetical protein MCU78_16540 [Streptomyces sp. TYQ1024]
MRPSTPPATDAGRLAGTVAGQGRPHPGRAPEAPENPSGPEQDPYGSPAPDTGADPEPAWTPAQVVPEPPVRPAPARAGSRNGGAAPDEEPVMRVLPLGTGMTLTGLGLGFLALRLRRR